MAKKVTISIPDMLHEKLENWRESFNLSKMFQDAVMITDEQIDEIVGVYADAKEEAAFLAGVPGAGEG